MTMSAEHAAIAALLRMNNNEDSQALPNTVANNIVEDDESTDGRRRKRVEVTGDAVPGTDSTGLEASEVPKKKRKTKLHYIEPTFPVAPRVVQVCKMPKTHVDHSYRDFTSVPPEEDYEHPTQLSAMTFAQKVHHILSNDSYANIITWMPHGRAFKIVNPKLLEQQKVLQHYFGHSRYSTFLSQLKNHGLKQITEGRDKGCYYHEFMLRGLPHLCKYMPAFKEGRKLVPDARNEPDFYTISALWPVPEKSLPARMVIDGSGAIVPARTSRAVESSTAPVLQGLFGQNQVNLGGSDLGDLFATRASTSSSVLSEGNVAAFLRASSLRSQLNVLHAKANLESALLTNPPNVAQHGIMQAKADLGSVLMNRPSNALTTVTTENNVAALLRNCGLTGAVASPAPISDLAVLLNMNSRAQTAASASADPALSSLVSQAAATLRQPLLNESDSSGLSTAALAALIQSRDSSLLRKLLGL